MDRRDEPSYRGYIARALESDDWNVQHGFGYMGLDISEVVQAAKTGEFGDYFNKKKPYRVWPRGLQRLPLEEPYGEAYIDATFRKLPKSAVTMGPVLAVVSFGITDQYDVDMHRSQKQKPLNVGWLPVQYISALIPLSEQGTDVLQGIYEQAWKEHTEEFAFLMKN